VYPTTEEHTELNRKTHLAIDAQTRKARRFVRIPEILERTGVKSRVTLHNWQKAGIFPKFVKIGPNMVGLPGDVFESWLDERAGGE